MRTVRIGNLEIGKIPRVVATLASLEAMKRFEALDTKPCDIAEVRLDLIGPDNDWLPAANNIQKAGTPIILTLRAASEGGKWSGRETERLTILKNAMPYVAAVDVELKSGLAQALTKKPGADSRPVIVSFHDFGRTPPLQTLLTVTNEALKQGAIGKVSTMVTTDNELRTLQQLLANVWHAPLCVIGMGERAKQTRIDFPRRGSCLTYGYFETPVAPGQLSAEEVKKHMNNAAEL